MRTRSFAKVGIWLAATALAAALPYALKFAADNDLWWHVRTGQMILEQGGLPDTDPFSFTAAAAPWTNHEWLSDVVVASVFASGGDRAMTLWRTLLLVTVLGVLARLLWRRYPHPFFVLAGLLAATPLIRIFINLRPHVYTYLFVLLMVLIFESAPRRALRLWLIPPLMVLWVNLHGGFVLGLGLLTLLAASRWLGLDGEAPTVDRAARRQLMLVLLCSFAAPLLNPYGLGLLVYLVHELGADHSLILEWQGIWHPEFAAYRLPFTLLLALPLLALAFARRLGPLSPWVMLGIGALATWIHGRFLILLVFFSLLVTFSCLAAMAQRHPGVFHGRLLERLRLPRWAWTACAVPLVAGLLQLGVDLSKKGLRLEVNPWLVPVEACEFLRRHDLGPNLLLRFDWGGYAIWHLYPDYRVSGDGRNLTVYEADFVDEMLRAYDEGRFTGYPERYDVDVILSESAGPTFHELKGSKGWVPVHRDRLAAVFVRPDTARALASRRRDEPSIQPASERFYFP